MNYKVDFVTMENDVTNGNYNVSNGNNGNNSNNGLGHNIENNKVGRNSNTKRNNTLKYNLYYANIKNRSAANHINVNNAMNINDNFAAFRKADLLNLINKSIQFFYKSKGKQLYKNINIPNIIATIMPSLSTVEYIQINDGSTHYILPLAPGEFKECKNGSRKCLSEDDLQYISLHIRNVDNRIVIYILYNDIPISALTDDATFINALSEKERGFMQAIFQNYDIIPPEGRSLESYGYFNGVNVWPYIVKPSHKTKTNKLRWNERVKVQEIPNKVLIKSMTVVEGGRRRTRKNILRK